MANLSKIKRDEMIAFLDELKKTHSDDASIRAFNMIENHLREKKYGLWLLSLRLRLAAKPPPSQREACGAANPVEHGCGGRLLPVMNKITFTHHKGAGKDPASTT